MVDFEFHTPVKYDGKEISLASIPYVGGLNTFSKTRHSNIPFSIFVSIGPAGKTRSRPAVSFGVVDAHTDSPFDAMMASDNDRRNDLRVDDDSDDIRVLLLRDAGDCDSDDGMVVASMSARMPVFS